jgi:hypothetical protein
MASVAKYVKNRKIKGRGETLRRKRKKQDRERKCCEKKRYST